MNDSNSTHHLRSWFVVLLLLGAYVLSFLDRQILSLLVKPIRADLGITDTQMSLLIGFAFALFYSTCGLPLARYADYRSRRGVILCGVALWSCATGVCGLARNYAVLFLARMGVGVGEAALSPAAYSLLSDYFPPQRRAIAISVYSTGICIGAGLALVLGSMLVQYTSSTTLPMFGEMRPWQLVFLLLGAAGLLYCPLLWLIREPGRQHRTTQTDSDNASLRAVLIANKSALIPHALGFAMAAFASYGCSAWVPTFFIRVHHMTIPQVGFAYGAIVTLLGTAGMVLGGWLADMWFKRGRADAAIGVCAGCMLAAAPFAAGIGLAANTNLAVFCVAMVSMLVLTPTGVAVSAVQQIMPPQMRAQTSALLLFVVNLIGQGLGPTAVALCTDYVFHDDKAVGFSLAITATAGLLISAILFVMARVPFRESYQRLLDGKGRAIAEGIALASNPA